MKEIVSFGPLCVAPEYQRQKLGKILIEHSFDVARKMGYDVNINFGNPGNYISRNLPKLDHTESDRKFDKNNHWKECTVTACGVILENSKAAHKDDNKDAYVYSKDLGL